MMFNSCRWARPRLAILAGDDDGRDLQPEDRRLVERHLIGCTSCRAERDSLANAVGLLRSAATVPSMTHEASSIWPELSQQIRRSRHARPGFGFGFNVGFGPGLGMAASLLGVGTAIGLISWNLGSASATRSHNVLARTQSAAPRPALPPDGPQVVEGRPTPKPEARLTAELDPKPTLPTNPGDPQRSQ